MCTQGCQTFIWGGEGTPTHDEEVRCFCVCEDDSWSDTNILGRASCVPALAHLIYGWVGLSLSTAALCHAAYQLDRQVSLTHREEPVLGGYARICLHVYMCTRFPFGVV